MIQSINLTIDIHMIIFAYLYSGLVPVQIVPGSNTAAQNGGGNSAVRFYVREYGGGGGAATHGVQHNTQYVRKQSVVKTVVVTDSEVC